MAVPEAETRSKGGKLIALTFDDGPGPYTRRLLEGLAKRGVKATFFMLGQQAENYDVTAGLVRDAGHQIASHTYDHPQLSKKTDSQVTWQISHTADILNGITGYGTHYLVRPPYGDYNSRVLSLLDNPAILWSVDPLDWKYRNADTVCTNIVEGAFDGAIVLAHDIHSTTVDGVLMAIDKLQAKGYEFVTVNELFRRRGVTLEKGHTYSSCKPTGTDLGPVSVPTVTEAGGSPSRPTRAQRSIIRSTARRRWPPARSTPARLPQSPARRSAPWRPITATAAPAPRPRSRCAALR